MAVTIDFETRSDVDLKKCGGYIYSRGANTSVMCLAWKFDDEDETHLWHPAFPAAGLEEFGARDLETLLTAVVDREEVHAHNAFFERVIWNNYCGPVLGWPELHPEQLHCTAALAASYALPRKLEKVAEVLGVAPKDMDGHRLMLKLSQPRKPRVAEWRKGGYDSPEHYTRMNGLLWHESKPEELERLFAYCRGDVISEEAVQRALPPMPDIERRAWLIDQEINWRGVHIDRAMVENALVLDAHEKALKNDELVQLTDGEVKGCTARPTFKKWLHAQGVMIPDTAADTIEAWYDKAELFSPEARRALEVWRLGNRTSINKYKAMDRRMWDDDRVRDILMFYAAHTGRWGGRGIQPQNFPRGKVKDMELAVRLIQRLSPEDFALFYDDPTEALSHALRGAICAPPGCDLMVSDYSAIENRGLFWCADDKPGLQVFADGKDPYLVEAGNIYDCLITDKSDPRRGEGKVVTLGCGYQMGKRGMVLFAESMGIDLTEDRSDELVKSWRKAHKPVVSYWYKIQAAAVDAIERGDGAPATEHMGIKFGVRGRFLFIQLPSGRSLAYLDPWVAYEMPDWEDYEGPPRPKIKYMGKDIHGNWSRQTTYGGKLTENIVQAVCRDIMRDAMIRLDDLRKQGAPYRQVLNVHDEIVAEVPAGEGSVKEFNEILSAPPWWAGGFPIAAAGFRCTHYRKD